MGRPRSLWQDTSSVRCWRDCLDATRTGATERLVDDLWGETVPESAQKMVQIYVSQLRKVLPNETLPHAATGVRHRDRSGDDRHRPVRATCRSKARQRMQRGTPHSRRNGSARRSHSGAASHWPSFRSRSHGPRRRGSDQLHLTCLEARIDADLDRGRHAELVAELEVLVGRYPLREGLRAQQLVALYRSGRQSEALAGYHTFRTRLSDELGLEPSKGLKDLERRILRQDPDLDLPAAAAGDAVRRRPRCSS